MEKGFSSFVESESSVNSLSSRLKQILIERFIKSLNKSKGVSAKIAQLASFLEIGIPVEVRHALGALQSRAKPTDSKTVFKILKEQYDTNPKKLFPHWREEPLAVTSIGQVHYARLADGQEVAVKVQHPKISAVLDAQLRKAEFIQSIAVLLGKKETDVLPEIRRAPMQECDYRQEALNQNKFREILASQSRVIVPRVHNELVRERVLVSDYIRGRSFQNFVAVSNQQERNEATEIIFIALMTAAFGHCLTQSDWHPGNFLFVDGKVVLLDFGRIIDYPRERMKLEAHFYMNFLTGNDAQAQALARTIFAKDGDTFDFDEFWIFLKQNHMHLLVDKPFHFTRAYAKSLNNQGRAYSKKHQISMDKNSLWAMVFAMSSWGIFAELEAHINFRNIALKTTKLGTLLQPV